MATNSLETDPLLSFGTPVEDELVSVPAAAPARTPASKAVPTGGAAYEGLAYASPAAPVADELVSAPASTSSTSTAPKPDNSTASGAAFSFQNQFAPEPAAPAGDAELVAAPVGPKLTDSVFGNYLATSTQLDSFEAVTAALDDPETDFDIDSVIEDAARTEAARMIAAQGIRPSSTAYKRAVDNTAIGIESNIRSEFMPMLAAHRQSLKVAAAAAEPDAARQAEKADQVGFLEQSFAYLGAGGLSAVAGTADLANFVLSSFGDSDAGALDIEFLRDMSGAVRDSSASLVENNTTEGFNRVQGELDTIINSDEGAGAKVVQMTGALMSGDGLSFVSAMLAQSVGYLAVSIVGAKGAGAGVKSALRGTTSLAGRASPASTRMVAAAGQNVASGRMAAMGNRAGLAVAVAAPVAGQTIQESVDQIEGLARTNPAGLRQLPGWKAAQASLTVELGHAPTDQQTLNRFSRRVAGASGAIAGGSTLAATIFAPFSERALSNLLSTRSIGTVGTGSTLRRAARLGAMEAASEGAEEFSQAIAGDVALRTVGAGQSVGTAIEDANTPDAQLAAYLGSVLGLVAGGGLAAASKPDPLRDAPAKDAPDGDTGATDTPAEGDGVTDPDPVSEDLSAENVKGQTAQSYRDAHAMAIHALHSDHGVLVTDGSTFGLSEDHGVFNSGSGEVDGGTFTPFFSDGDVALGVDRATGDIAYAVNTADEGVFWTTDPTQVGQMDDIIDAVDAIQSVASITGSEIDVELATLYGRRRDKLTSMPSVVDELAPATTASEIETDTDVVATIREVNTADAIATAFERSKFGGLVSMDGDPRLDPASESTYIASTRARLNRRAEWYQSTMSNTRKLGETVTLRLERGDLPNNAIQSEAVRSFIAKVVATDPDQRMSLAVDVNSDPRQTDGARAAARQVITMLDAARTIDQTLYTKTRTARQLTAKTASEAVTHVAAIDPLASAGDSRKTSTLFETKDLSTFDEGANVGSLDVALNTPAATAPTEVINRVVDAVSTAPNTLAETSVSQPVPFAITQSSNAGAALRNVVRQRLLSGGTYGAELSKGFDPAATAAAQFDPDMLVQIEESMDTAMAGYAAARMEQGISIETLAREIVHTGGVDTARAKAVINRALTVAVEDAANVQTAALAQADQLVRNAVTTEDYDTPVPTTELDDFVKATNRHQSDNNVRIEWFESLEAYRAGVLDARLKNVEAATLEDVVATSAAIRAEFPTVGASAMFIKGADGHKDRVVLLRNRFKDIAGVERVVAHELVAHYALRKMFTENGIIDVSNQILNSGDKGIKNLVNATRRKIVDARVAARVAEAKTTGAAVPSNLREQMERQVNHDSFRATLGEEVLGEAVERGLGKDLVKKGVAQRVIDLARKILTGRSGLVIRDVTDMTNLIHAARQRAGLGNDWLNPAYNPDFSDMTGGGYNLHWFQKAREKLFDEEAAIHRVADTARTFFGLNREADRLSDGITQAAGLARRNAGRIQGLHISPMRRQLEEVRARLGLEHKDFYTKFDQLMYLNHSKERIKGLAYMYGKFENPDNNVLRAEIIAEAKQTTDDAELARLSDELYAIQDKALDKVNNEEPGFGRHLVGRTFAEIDEHLADLEDMNFAKEINALGLTSENGLMRQTTEAILQNRRDSNYGDSGYGLTRLLGWKHYVPMAEFEGTDTGDGGDAAILRLNYDTLTPSASLLASVEGTGSIPRTSVFMQLMAAAQRSSKDVVSNDINRAFAEIAFVEETTVNEGGLATTTLNVRDGLEFVIEKDSIKAAVPYAEVGGVLFNLRSKYGKERVQTAWRKDGSADIYAIKDNRLANAFNARVREDFPAGTTGGTVGRIMQKLTRIQGRLLTSYNPLFVVFRQFPRDLAQAMAQAGFEQNLGTGGTFKVAKDAFTYLPAMERFFLSDSATRETNLKEWRADTKHPMHSFAKRADLGGVTFFEQQFRDPAAGPTFIEGGTAGARILRGSARTGEVIESLSNASDNAVRQALFDQIVRTENAKPEAERRGTAEEIDAYANEVATQTMNFSQRSSAGRFGSMLHPFFQTALTGTDAVIQRRMWKGGKPPIEQVRQADGSYRTQLKADWGKEINVPLMTFLGGMGIASTLAAFAAVQAGGEDGDDSGPEFKLRPSTLMRSYFMPGFDRPVQVSVQPGLMGAVHATGAAVAMISAGHHNQQEVARAWRDSMLYNLTPLNSAMGGEFTIDTVVDNLIPTLLQPILQHTSNKDAFGNPLTSRSSDTGEAEGVSTLYARPSMPLVYERIASEWRDTAVAMGFENSDPSPELIRHYMRGWTGGVGQTFDKGMKALQSANDGDPFDIADLALEFTGLQATDPRFAHYNQYFSLLDTTIAPMMVEYRRARKEDILNKAVPETFSLGQTPGPAMAEVFARYNGAIRDVSRTTGRTRNAASLLKKQLRIARGDGDTAATQRIKGEIEDLYTNGANDLRTILDGAGVEY